jgi:hypothetical protein
MPKYKNLWRELTNIRGPEFYQHNGPLIDEVGGVQVYHNPAGSFDFVLEGACIGMRAAYHKDRHEPLFAILEGTTPVAQPVAEHCRAHGHTALSYAEASAEERCRADGYAVPPHFVPEWFDMVKHYTK